MHRRFSVGNHSEWSVFMLMGTLSFLTLARSVISPKAECMLRFILPCWQFPFPGSRGWDCVNCCSAPNSDPRRNRLAGGSNRSLGIQEQSDSQREQCAFDRVHIEMFRKERVSFCGIRLWKVKIVWEGKKLWKCNSSCAAAKWAVKKQAGRGSGSLRNWHGLHRKLSNGTQVKCGKKVP